MVAFFLYPKLVIIRNRLIFYKINISNFIKALEGLDNKDIHAEKDRQSCDDKHPC